MKDQGKKKLLWVDDDSESRFVYEKYVLEAKGWEVIWTRTVRQGMKELTSQPFNAVILDQMIPLTSREVKPDADIWSGCFLLYWLRKKQFPYDDALLSGETSRWKNIYEKFSPDDSNIEIPAIIISGFHHKMVLKTTKMASYQDNTIKFLSKPVNIDLVQGFFDSIY